MSDTAVHRNRPSLAIAIALSLSITLYASGCGWTLDDPPPYPDLGVGGEEAENNTSVEE